MESGHLTPRDLYRLRHVSLLAQRAALRAWEAQANLEELLLELERRYGLLGQEAVIDIHTGLITHPVVRQPNPPNQPREAKNEPVGNAHKGAP